MISIFRKPTLEDLEAKRAGKFARYEECRRQMNTLSSFPGSMVEEARSLAEQVAALDVRIEHMKRSNATVSRPREADCDEAPAAPRSA